MEFIEELRFLKEQLKFKEKVNLPKRFDNVVIAGMGGSGLVGKVFSEFYSGKPLCLVDDYRIPKFVSKSTLFIAISSSGNTEETVTATKAAKKNKAQIVTISSGGRLSEYGDQNIGIPKIGLQPRSATGHMLMPLLRGFGLVSQGDIDRSYRLLSELDSDNSDCMLHAKRIAKNDSIPVIYGSHPFKSIAYRWKTQFNENAKVLGYSNSFPELNHNDTMALAKTYRKDAFYFMVFGAVDRNIDKRIRVTARITDSRFNLIGARGASQLERMFYLLHYGDYISYGLGLLRGVDPTDITLIERLKKMIKEG